MKETETVTPTNYLTHPRNAHLVTLTPDRQRRSPKMKAICVTLLNNGAPLTREEVTLQVFSCFTTGKRPGVPYRPTSNGCYFRRIHAGHMYHDEACYSVIINGLVRVAGKTKTGRLTYELTDAGRAFARG